LHLQQSVCELAQELVRTSKFPLKPHLLLGGVTLAPHTTLLDAGISDGTKVFADMYPLVMTTSADGSTMLWDADLGACEMVLEGHHGPVYSACVTPSFRWAVTGSDDCTAKVWNVAKGNCLATLVGHEEAVYAASFSPSFTLIVTASADFSARIWSWSKGGECTYVLAGHNGPVLSAYFTEDSRTVLTHSSDSTQKMWSVDSGKCKDTLHKHKPVDLISYSPDGRYFVSPSGGDVAHICLAETGECIHKLVGHHDCILSAAFASDTLNICIPSSCSLDFPFELLFPMRC